MDEDPDAMSNDRESRAVLSRAVCFAERMISLLEVDHEFWLSGRCSVLRAYARSISATIICLVEYSENVDAVGFDFCLELVTFLCEELKEVMCGLMDA